MAVPKLTQEEMEALWAQTQVWVSPPIEEGKKRRLERESKKSEFVATPQQQKSPATKSPVFLSKSSEIERINELTASLKRKAGDSGPGFTLTMGGDRETQVGTIPAGECELPVPKGTGVLVYSARIEDYRRWIPLIGAPQPGGQERFRQRYLVEVIVPRCNTPYKADEALPQELEVELEREWMRTAEAYQRQKRAIAVRKQTAKEYVSAETLLDSLRALAIKHVVRMLDQESNPESVNVAAMAVAEKIIMEERGDEIKAERERLKHESEALVASLCAPPPKRQASEVGPFGETTDTHDIVYENVKTGAGKGQTMPIRKWVRKSDLADVDEGVSVPYVDSWRGIEWESHGPPGY